MKTRVLVLISKKDLLDRNRPRANSIQSGSSSLSTSTTWWGFLFVRVGLFFHWKDSRDSQTLVRPMADEIKQCRPWSRVVGTLHSTEMKASSTPISRKFPNYKAVPHLLWWKRRYKWKGGSGSWNKAYGLGEYRPGSGSVRIMSQKIFSVSAVQGITTFNW